MYNKLILFMASIDFFEKYPSRQYLALMLKDITDESDRVKILMNDTCLFQELYPDLPNPFAYELPQRLEILELTPPPILKLF